MDPRVAVLFVITGVILALLYLRYKNLELRHKERMTALEKGAALPVLAEPVASAGAPRVYLLRGLIWLFTGAALTASIFAIASVAKTGRRDITAFDLERRLVHAERLRARGATEDQIKEVMAEKPQEQGDPRVLAVLGLIPIGVGAAYLIFYASEEKRMSALVPAAHDSGGT